MDTKKRKKIDISNLLTTGEVNNTISISDSVDYFITLRSSQLGDLASINKEIIFIFANNDLRADVVIRIVMDSKISLSLKVFIKAPANVEGCVSKLDMKAMVVNPDSEITFVPILEIDEMNVSVDHKSTIGQPDPEWLNYMQSKGLTKDEVIDLIASSFLS